MRSVRLLSCASLLAFSVACGKASAAAITFDYTGGLQTYTVPTTGSYSIVATGASGGTANARDGSVAAAGGFGAVVASSFA